MNPIKVESSISLNNSGKNITFTNFTSSGSIAGFDSLLATAFPETWVLHPIIYNNIKIEMKEIEDERLQISESNDIWLKLSESSFGFWDNDLDSQYDLL